MAKEARDPRAYRLGWIPAGREEIAEDGTFARFEQLPDVEGLMRS